ncbi:hypothetical protein CHU98_g1876 [Xylaria longipes]|nr:hypothetical protein CHU98_g1876 [Xylaria longipes]
MTRRIIQQSMPKQEMPSSPDTLPARIHSTAFGIAVHTKRDEEEGKESDASALTKKKKTVYTIVKTGLLIPGDGEPVKNGALVIENKLIAWVGSEAHVPHKYTDGPHRTFSIPVVMPGLWDVHTHFGGEAPEIGEGNLDGVKRDAWERTRGGETEAMGAREGAAGAAVHESAARDGHHAAAAAAGAGAVVADRGGARVSQTPGRLLPPAAVPGPVL